MAAIKVNNDVQMVTKCNLGRLYNAVYITSFVCLAIACPLPNSEFLLIHVYLAFQSLLFVIDTFL
ncbi:hypothetical protein EGR_09483 [Echinococcus granulosus]|uniref:Uncharacterized protein n=1 Tax=Echinococcus granulosus TaxID=6210 RepID=W6U3J0_ECHGR|nr:hypothetical protein EGR_09483 [Echinococcus granulosus]EUB55675.1 hypothetical protein EGR_09483 [Echinococcus granulosus]